ncbi:hypothetical protein STSO111631_11425 [Stackebrandtia soli]
MTGPPLIGIFDCHARKGGPYGGVSEFLVQVAPRLRAANPELVGRHEIALLSVARDLRGMIPSRHETLTSLAVSDAQIRFHPRVRTRHLAHGMAELFRTWDAPAAVCFDNVDMADPVTREMLVVLLRRVDPAVLELRIGTSTAAPVELGEALTTYATRVDAPTGDERGVPTDPDEARALARTYVQHDGTRNDPALRAAYWAAPASERAAWHDARAEQLSAEDRWMWKLGAIPYHREHGSSTTDAVSALRTAMEYCLFSGYYEATVDLCRRGLSLTTPDGDHANWWAFTTSLGTSLGVLERTDEALAVYDEARSSTISPTAHMSAAYSTAMLHARHPDRDRRDATVARAWVNQAIAFAGTLPGAKERAIAVVFNDQGLALLETRAGDHELALLRVDRGLSTLDDELEPDERPLDRARLWHNRSQLHVALGDERALDDLNKVIELDPHHGEYYFDRAAVHRRAGRLAEAIADYTTAIKLSPPFPEAYYNRADALLAVGASERALSDLDDTLVMDPSYLDAIVNRASLRYDLEDMDGAGEDLTRGLRLDPDNPRLLCTSGLVACAVGDLTEAERLLTRAIDSDPEMSAAWVNRATVRFDRGDALGAIQDLDAALKLADDPVIRFNRGLALKSVGRHTEAMNDFSSALANVDATDPLVDELRDAMTTNPKGTDA